MNGWFLWEMWANIPVPWMVWHINLISSNQTCRQVAQQNPGLGSCFFILNRINQLSISWDLLHAEKTGTIRKINNGKHVFWSQNLMWILANKKSIQTKQDWLVVSTHLKNISQKMGIFPKVRVFFPRHAVSQIHDAAYCTELASN